MGRPSRLRLSEVIDHFFLPGKLNPHWQAERPKAKKNQFPSSARAELRLEVHRAAWCWDGGAPHPQLPPLTK